MFKLRPSVLLVILLPCLAYSSTILRKKHLIYGEPAHYHGHIPDMEHVPFKGIIDRDGTKTNLNETDRIVDITSIKKFPWQVSVQWLGWDHDERWHICGGFILSERWISTAAHCVSGYEDCPEEHAIFSGSNDLRLEGYMSMVQQIVVHEDWDWDTLNDDIAWIKLESDLDLDDVTRKAIAVPVQGAELQRKKVEIAGWGRIYDLGPLSSMLQSIELKVVPMRKCISAYSNVYIDPTTLDNSKMCAGLPNKNTCNGDSGGALVSKSQGSPVVAGIVSFGVSCGDWNHPGVFTKMSYYADLTSFVISG